ncbi:MAG: YHS domain-containing protein [Chloroflexi bacterium]|nr:YHS domain-containing protein [Chloroflexota bacterium]
MATAIDPICQMDVDTDNPPGGQSEYNGETYYFCAPGCKVAFDKEPEKYLAAASGGHDDHGDHGHDHGHDHGPGGHSHGHHMPEREESAAPASKPGFFARLFGKK